VETSQAVLMKVKGVVPNTPVFANTGVRVANVAAQLAVSDGAVVGTTFKQDGYIWNDVDVARVKEFMTAARAARG
jgi:predicted TIM-barrel enzyme